MSKLKSNILLAVSITFFSYSLRAQLTITSGANLVTNNGTYVVLNNTGLSNSGSISAAGSSSIVFTGTASASGTPLNSASAISNITINKAAGGVLLGNSVPVSNTVQLTSGIINLNGYDLNLGTTGNLSGESALSYITGTTGGAIVRTATLNNPAAVNPGNLGITITSSANLGVTTIRRSHQQQTISSTGNSINRYFDIAPANNTNLNATVRFSYLDGELNGLSKSNLIFYSSSDNGASWFRLGATSTSVASNYVERTGIVFLSRFTLGDNSAILPIRLVSFTGKLLSQGAELQWVTASENSNAFFEIERSEDGIVFSRFASIPSHGSSNLSQTYTVTDTKPFSGVQFYRLKQIDKDGTYTYSKVVALSKGGFTNKILTVFPSPAHTVVSINFTSSRQAKANLQIVNSEGRQVMNREIEANTGLNTASLNISNLPAGAYYLRCVGISTQPIRFTKIN